MQRGLGERCVVDGLYQIRLHRNDKKTTPDTENAESEEERGNLNNSDTNGHDITRKQTTGVGFPHERLHQERKIFFLSTDESGDLYPIFFGHFVAFILMLNIALTEAKTYVGLAEKSLGGGREQVTGDRGQF